MNDGTTGSTADAILHSLEVLLPAGISHAVLAALRTFGEVHLISSHAVLPALRICGAAHVRSMHASLAALRTSGAGHKGSCAETHPNNAAITIYFIISIK